MIKCEKRRCSLKDIKHQLNIIVLRKVVISDHRKKAVLEEVNGKWQRKIKNKENWALSTNPRMKSSQGP